MYVCACMTGEGGVCMLSAVLSDSLELELRVSCEPLKRVLGTELLSSARAVCNHNL